MARPTGAGDSGGAGYQVPAEPERFWQPPALLALTTVQVRLITPEAFVIVNVLPVGTDFDVTT